MGEVSIARGSLKMPLLLFALLSTALAVPAPCPPMPPTDCGEGMTNCPGETDPMGCPMPEICVAEGDECPFFCPHVEHPHCGFEMSNCPSPVDAMGCETPVTCVMVDWAAGEECPHVCPYNPPMDCGEGMTNCPGDIDPMGCMMPEICVAEGDAASRIFAMLRKTSAHSSVHTCHPRSV